MSRLPRTVCESAGEHYCDGAGNFLTIGFSAPWCGMVQVHGQRTWREGQPGMRRPGPAHRVFQLTAMARRRGQFADLRYPATPTLAHMLTRADNGTDFGPFRNGDGTMPAGAHSLRECGRAMARRRGQFADLRYPVTHRCFASTLRRRRTMGQILDH
jgi:hypothetical protein